MSKDLDHLKAELNAATRIVELIAGEIAELESEKSEKWEPEGGEWWVNASGRISNEDSTPNVRSFGTERKTEQQAEAAAERMRTFNRLDAWIDENVGESICKVSFSCNSVNVIRYMPTAKVLELEKLTNDGVVVL